MGQPVKEQPKGAGAAVMVRARVVAAQYGKHVRGATIEVSEVEYRRVGKSVLLSRDDEDTAARAAADQQRTSAQAATPSTVGAWADKEAEAARLVRARFVEEQRRQREVIEGEAK
jgi:hypothetical protein